MGVSFRLCYSQEQPEGFKIVGTIDLPIVKEKVGYICLQFEFFIFDWKFCWVIT